MGKKTSKVSAQFIYNALSGRGNLNRKHGALTGFVAHTTNLQT